MRAWTFVGAAAATLVVLCGEARATTPVVVEYSAPPECASSDAFHALLSAQLAQTSNPDRPWRFSVSIRHESDYVGVLQMETGSRELRAPTCDEVTAALSLVIAMAQPELPAPPPPPAVIEERQPPPPAMISAMAFAPPPPSRDAVEPREQTTKDSLTWRLGARGEHWDDGSQLGFTGAFITAGVETPVGFTKMHFEVGVGAMYHQHAVPQNYMPIDPPVPIQPYVLLGLIDAQACPIDLPIAHTGIDVMGCARFTFGLTKGVLSNSDFGGGAWGGGGARLRWQSPWRFFVDGHFAGLYGTRVEGIPALMDVGGSVGFRI